MSGADVIVFVDADAGTEEAVPRAQVPPEVATAPRDGQAVPVARAVKRTVGARVVIEVFDAEGQLLQRTVGPEALS